MQTRTTLQTRITATLLLNGFKPREIRQFKPPIQQVITTIRRKVGVAPFAGGRPVSTPADPERLRFMRSLKCAGAMQTEIAAEVGVTAGRVAAILRPQRQRARDAIKRAVARGDVIRPEVCDDCGLAGKIEAHHADYHKPLSVEWLCVACHGLRRLTPAKAA